MIVDLNYFNIYTRVVVFLLLGVASYFDSKELRIPDKLNLGFLILRLALIPFISFSWGNIYGLIVGMLIILIPAMIKNKPMGGDIKMLGVLGLYLGVKNVLILLIGTVILAFLYFLLIYIKKESKENIPLAPFVLCSFILMNTVSFFI